MTEAKHPVHGYLTCEDTEHAYEKQRAALERILKRSCIHCSAWENAASALGLTYNVPQHVPDSVERVVARQRADILKFRDVISDGGWQHNFPELDRLMMETERYEKYREGEGADASPREAV